MDHKNDARFEMINECCKYYEDDRIELKKIDDFQKDYHGDRAILWYTADSFLFRLVNKAFRTELIEKIYVFRLFITDLYNQLLKEFETQQKMKRSLKVYRGAQIESNLVKQLKNSTGILISMNGFSSATSDIEVAKIFAGDGKHNLGYESVLFELNIDPDIQPKPYADIKQHSKFPAEKEFLFSVGTTWHINSVELNRKKSVWVISLRLTSDQDTSSIELLSQVNELISRPCTPLTLANVLLALGEHDTAKIYYNEMLKDHLNEQEKEDIYMGLGILWYEKNESNIALDYFEKTQISKTFAQSPHNLCQLSISINQVTSYLRNNKRTLSIKYYCEMNSIILICLLENEDNSYVKIFNNIGIMNHKNGSYEEAMKNYTTALQTVNDYETVQNKQEHAAVYNNIAGIHYCKGDYDSALINYEQAIRIADQMVSDSWIRDFKKNQAAAQRRYVIKRDR
ncbi:unnamed protein product [Didymodactylos carnosus]|uniref:ADP ribosyltransferase domain-containing protein n=1 Tax=Didymodactylos carnosus TaxID=1234261 RepID=A0A815K5B2_9BILA|nr:unnamed protein product [Didymodactylos carnosus]CAF1391256.1 unnamed protein product [Didymodactylos carnosus]CAF4046493.1 unnamed protein product [Didymodactylos carnosus]CAF4285782.1 unnamed protein product [Didymodactylos carnosus]